ncbi:hypothetical protein ACWFNE_04765 [Cellulomonas sp. NPDC055163]
MSLALTAVAVLAVTGCSADEPAPASSPGTGSTAEPTAASVMAPTGAPSELTPAEGTGEEIDLGGYGSFRAPEGSTTEPGGTEIPGAEQVLVRMPDATERGVPAIQVTWQADAPAGAVEQSWSTEQSRTIDPSVSDYVRSPVEWPGSESSVVATWTEDVALAEGGTTEVDALGLWLETADGTVVLAIAFAPGGELDGSTSLEALRSLAVS